MVMIAVYTSMLSGGETLVEACWKAIEILRNKYGITVFMEVLNTSLIFPGESTRSIAVVGDKTVSYDEGSKVEDLAGKIVEAVLEFMVKGGSESIPAPYTVRESWEVEDEVLADV